MALLNYLRKEIDAKIVYYGPGLCGKTTNIQFIHQNLQPDQRGNMLSLATDQDVTLFFDFLPIELEDVVGFKMRFHLFTVPGQVYYGATRRAVLMGADGVIFVADSQIERSEDNLQSIKELEENLRQYGKKLETTPFVIQYNKRDLPDILPVEELNKKINHLAVPYFESVATEGKGVFESLTMICRMVLKVVKDGTEARGSAAMDSTASEAKMTAASRVERRIPPPESPP
jgi:signal recognition particle receptor subunit beta